MWQSVAEIAAENHDLIPTFHLTVLFLHPLETSEKQSFSEVLKGGGAGKKTCDIKWVKRFINNFQIRESS